MVSCVHPVGKKSRSIGSVTVIKTSVLEQYPIV
ncbi:hypothetical protein MEY_03781 [Candida albicans 19F]|nr:hypothetical protein MEY_03781 [Candida albicans 19F]